MLEKNKTNKNVLHKVTFSSEKGEWSSLFTTQEIQLLKYLLTAVDFNKDRNTIYLGNKIASWNTEEIEDYTLQNLMKTLKRTEISKSSEDIILFEQIDRSTGADSYCSMIVTLSQIAQRLIINAKYKISVQP